MICALLPASSVPSFFNNYDIRSGDILVLNNREYPISDVNPWSVQEPFMVLVLNDVKAVQELDAVFVR